jgi:hypothetical protein
MADNDLSESSDMTSLLTSLGFLVNLKYLDLHNNQLGMKMTTLYKILGDLKCMEGMDSSGNRMEKLSRPALCCLFGHLEKLHNLTELSLDTSVYLTAKIYLKKIPRRIILQPLLSSLLLITISLLF